jgi:predicted nucleic acid-binding protein
LLLYEVANGLTRLASANLFPVARLAQAWQSVMDLPITYHSLEADGPQVVNLALRPGRKSAYDAAYIVLAQQLGGELWTLDGPLARNASGIGLRVHLAE